MKERGPFKTKDTKAIYKNPWITVYEDSIVRPGGSDGIFGVVDVKDGTRVVALTPENSILLSKEFKYGLGEYVLECIGGGIDAGETPEAAAKRELREESGMESDNWEYLGYSVSLPAFVNFKEHLFLTQHVQSVADPETDDGEVIEVVEMPLTEAIQKIMNGEIIQDSSSVAIFKAYTLLNQ